MPDLLAQVGNCLLVGEDWSEIGTRRVRNRIRLQLGTDAVEIRQRPALIGVPWDDQLKGVFNYTTDIVVADPKSQARGERIASNVSDLLSLASMSQVRPFHFDFGAGPYGPLMTYGVTSYYRPTIEMQDGADIKAFLECCWSGYRRECRRRRLTEAIEYLVTAERPGLPIEVQLLLIFSCLECLKTTFARSRSIPESRRGFHRVTPTFARTLTRRQLEKQRTFGFEDLLRQMLGDVGMKRGLKRLIRLRNQIIHQGLSTWSHKSKFKAHDTCHDILREYLLRLMNYKGEYLVYSSGSRTHAVM